MSKEKTLEELNHHKDLAISSIDAYLSTLISSDNPSDQGRADKLCYWLQDYMTFLNFEKYFSPNHLRRYKRGEIIKVHLGYNIGSEEGGLHYAVILDKNNSLNAPTITVVPLTSVKPTTDINNLFPGNVYLGNELFNSLNSRVTDVHSTLVQKIKVLQKTLACMDPENINANKSDLYAATNAAKAELRLLQRMQNEISKMKKGSIALTRQITTISKIRIYDPKTNHDVLSGIRLSSEKLDAIDAAINNYFIGR